MGLHVFAWPLLPPVLHLGHQCAVVMDVIKLDPNKCQEAAMYTSLIMHAGHQSGFRQTPMVARWTTSSDINQSLLEIYSIALIYFTCAMYQLIPSFVYILGFNFPLPPALSPSLYNIERLRLLGYVVRMPNYSKCSY